MVGLLQVNIWPNYFIMVQQPDDYKALQNTIALEVYIRLNQV